MPPTQIVYKFCHACAHYGSLCQVVIFPITWSIIGAASWDNLSSGFPARSGTSRAVQPLKMARGLKFRIKMVVGLYYLCSENKCADQLRVDRAADLRLCFRISNYRSFHDAPHKLLNLSLPFTE